MTTSRQRASSRTKPSRRGPGRPSDEAIDDALLRAATAELTERGYHALSMESIAARAGVSKVSLYRRWKSKADIAGDVFRAMAAEPGPPPASLAELIREQVEGLTRPDAQRRGRVVMRTMGEIADHPKLLALYREHLLEPRLARVRQVVEAARRSGELTTDAPTDVVCAFIAGPIFLGYVAAVAGLELDVGAASDHLSRLLHDALRPKRRA